MSQISYSFSKINKSTPIIHQAQFSRHYVRLLDLGVGSMHLHLCSYVLCLSISPVNAFQSMHSLMFWCLHCTTVVRYSCTKFHHHPTPEQSAKCVNQDVCVQCFYFKLVDSCQASFVQGAIPTRDQRGRWSTSSSAPCCQASASCLPGIQHWGSLQTYCRCSWWQVASWKKEEKDWSKAKSDAKIEKSLHHSL